MLKIIPVENGEDLRRARLLFEEYAASLDFNLCFQNFEEELAKLPGDYTPPSGCLFLGIYDGHEAGCIALRRISRDVCEMKRLYVRPRFRGSGIGRSLAKAVIEQAKEMGYSGMRLDTVPAMERARALYASLGFKEIPPYCHNPIPGAVFLELKFNPGPRPAKS